MLRSLLKLGSLLGVLLLGPAGCDDTEACKSAPECKRDGKCTANEKGRCVVGSDQDCKSSEACKLHGLCGVKESACVAATDADCKTAEDCKKLGACSAYQDKCVDLGKSVHAECSKSC